MESSMSFKFERFTDPDRSFDAKVTLRGTGQLGFNSGAINLFGLRVVSHVVLYFDQKSQVVGIELTDNGAATGAIKLMRGVGNTFVRAKNFCDRFSIDYQRSRRFDLKKDPETGYLYFFVQQPDGDFQPPPETESPPADTSDWG
jgi:hypothetical protein